MPIAKLLWGLHLIMYIKGLLLWMVIKCSINVSVIIVASFWKTLLIKTQVKGYWKPFLILLARLKETFSLHFLSISVRACMPSFSNCLISTFSSDCNVLKDMVQMCFHTEDSTKYSTRCLINTSQWKNKWINSKPARKNTFSIASRIGLDVFIGSLICSHGLHICQSNIFSLSAERSTHCWHFWSLRKHYAMAKWWLYFILVSICIGKQLLSTFANDFS